MYDRYTIFSPIEDLEGMFAARNSEKWTPLYNAAPTLRLPIITAKKPGTIQLAHWGLASKMANNKSISPRLFNLPAESAFQRPLYRKALQSSRCIILCDGFYLWKQVSKKQKVPYFCYYANYLPFAIAGIFEEYEDIDGNLSATFNMITSAADRTIKDYQEDMPAILAGQSWKDWLHENTGMDQIQSILNQVSSGKIQMHAVGPRLVNSKYNDKNLIQPSAPSDQFGNYTLFN